MTTLIPASSHNYDDPRLGTSVENLDLPRHRWYAFKEGFSETLVKTAAEEVASARRTVRILDPFAGSGTTLVTAGRLGLEATGLELNPFLAFASRAKCVPNGWRKKSYFARLDAVLKNGRYERRSPLEGLSTFTEGTGRKQWLYNLSVLRGFTSLHHGLRFGGRYRHPLKLALLAALSECCNAKRDGKCLRYRKDWESFGYSSADLREVFHEKARRMFDDVANHSFEAAGLRIINGDTRRILDDIPRRTYDLIVTSPPYLNSFDYSDVYRPELFTGGFVSSNKELRKIRLNSIRSHVQVNWEPSEDLVSPMIKPIVSELKERKLWNSNIPEMVQSYFADMAVVLTKSLRSVRKGGQAWMVVATSSYAGVEVPVDLILADVGVRCGWSLRGVYVLRHMRAAGQNSKPLRNISKFPLRESLIILDAKK